MANNIKIVGNILSTTTTQRYSQEDINLVSSRNLQENFGGTGDYIEYFVYDAGGNLLNINYNYLDYKLPTDNGLTPGVSTPPNTRGRIQTTNVGIESTLAPATSSLYPIIEIDPVNDLQSLGYSSGEFKVRYNFFNTKLSNYINEALFVKEISPNRTEVRLASVTLTNDEIESVANSMIEKINDSTYVVDYLLNFGNNEQYLAINVALNKATTGYEILFKLYQPLPLSVQEKQTLWIVEEKVVPYNFDINLDTLITPAPGPTLRGPNFDIEIPNQGTVATSYQTYTSLVAGLQSLQNSSYQQVLNLLTSQSVDINIDYTDFDNFVFFGSAYQRLSNFYTKAKQIEDYNNLITTYSPLTSSTPSLITEINQYSSSIVNIVSQFDGYESYLYFESSSYAWPKSGSIKPYSLLSTGSAIVISWYSTTTGSAQDYDLNNYNNLEYAIPSFLKDDDTNQPFLLFLNMVGHYFDNIWIYLKSITDLNKANNNLEVGISKDLVYERLKSLGLHLYNSQAGEDVDQFLIGANTGSSIWNNNTTYTSSYLNNIPRKDLVAELYKRIYHNLPLLMKQKGTVEGLDNLMTVFGIPNRKYYTIYSGSNDITYYTPTGSASTSSILNVKEFGGSLKANLINGYNNDKVRIVDNSITTNYIYSGSVLSPLLSLQTFPTASSEFRDGDMHYIDISFSPQTQLDTYISGAVASNNPTWSLDDYIGDPGYLYSSSYGTLDTQRKLYYQTGVSGYAPFTASALDYNGFIRLIQYFDNALFKMLADFVPERTSLSTGVTFNSPVLERNKAPYALPNVATQSVNTAEYQIASASSEYGSFYNALGGDKSAWYSGDISGSIVDVNQYFEDIPNPYLGNWDVWNYQHTSTESIDTNKFLHSDFNVLFNNVSQSVISIPRKHIEYIWGTTGSITSSAELQDSYLSLRSYNTSRYEGSKLTSLLYNTYTSASYTGSDGFTIQNGDISYGKTAVIDRQSYKLGWVKNIPSESKNFKFKTIVNLKYLVNSDSELTELSATNNNLFEVQNIFKSGTPIQLSISDVNNPTFQKPLDGVKTIFKGGYSFDPILFREKNESLTFRFDNPITSSNVPFGIGARNFDKYTYYARDNNGNPIHAVPSNPWESNLQPEPVLGDAFHGRYVYLINDQIAPANTSVASKSYPKNEWDLKFGGQGLSNSKLNFISSGSFTLSNGTTQIRKGNNQWAYLFDLLNFNTQYFNNEPSSDTYIQLSDDKYYYKVPRTSTYTLSGSIPFTFRGDDGSAGLNPLTSAVGLKIVGIVEKSSTPNDPSSWTYITCTTLSGNVPSANNVAIQSNYNLIIYDGNCSNIVLYANLNSSVSLNEGEYLRFWLYIVDISNAFGNPPPPPDVYTSLADGTAMIGFGINGPYKLGSTFPAYKAFFDVRDTGTTNIVYQYTSSYDAINYPHIFTQSVSPSNAVTFSYVAWDYFVSASTFAPKNPTANYYTPVIDYFGIQKYDLFRFGSFEQPTSKYYEVVNILTGSISRPSLTLSATYSPGNNVFYSFDTYTPYKLLPGDKVTVTGGVLNNNKTVTIDYVQTFTINQGGTNVIAIYFKPSSPDTINQDNFEPARSVTFNFLNHNSGSIVIFSQNIDPTVYSNQNFAILRPKLNETSVIVDYQKQPGEVSQTLLIPYDADQQLKNSVGNVYKTLNPSIQI